MMGEGEETPSKTPKSSSALEQPPPSSPATVFPDWASIQAYYNPGGTTPLPPPGFFYSSMASSPQGHPYMWATQILPPYGTPPHAYVTMYPPGTLYPHPLPPGTHPYSPYVMPSTSGIAESTVAGASGVEVDGKSNEEQERRPLKRSKRSLGSLGRLNMLTGEFHEIGKSSGASANGIFPQSIGSGSEGSSQGTEENSQNQKQGDEHGSGDEAQNGSVSGRKSSEVIQTLSMATELNQTTQLVAIPQGGITGPTTTLNIGMSYWGSATAPVSMARAKLPNTPSTAALVPSAVAISHDGVPSDISIQDEKELKKERRKKSNRESARRSRLRKQAECEDLARHVVTLTKENDTLKEELQRVREMCEKLASENALLTERL